MTENSSNVASLTGRWNTGRHDMEVREGRRIYVMCAPDDQSRIKIGIVGREGRLADRPGEVARNRRCRVEMLGSVELPKCDEQVANHFEFAVRFWLTQHGFALTDDFDWLLPTSTSEVEDWSKMLEQALCASMQFVGWDSRPYYRQEP